MMRYLFFLSFLIIGINPCQAFLCRNIFEKQPTVLIPVVLVRHGESELNKEKAFAGWADVNLTSKGEREAYNTGAFLKNRGFRFDRAFVSNLKRSMQTLRIILNEMGMADIPVIRNWKLNERHLGDLQGKKIEDMIKMYGEGQVTRWRTDFLARPPEVKEDYRTENVTQRQKPESFKDLRDRVLPFWYSDILPEIRNQNSVIVSAHLNTLRILVQHLEGVPDGNISSIKIPTGTPIVYFVNSRGVVISRQRDFEN